MTPADSLDEEFEAPDITHPAGPVPGAQPARGATAAKGLLALFFLYLFLSSINLMGHGLKTAGEDPQNDQRIRNALALTDNPIVGLCVGILITSIIQSSSFTTSFVVTLVAAHGEMTFTQAVPIIMGANIGTTITNTLVAVGHIGRRREFRRAFAGSLMHDMFNVCAVLLFFPLNWAFKIVEWPAEHLSDVLSRFTGFGGGKEGWFQIATKPLSQVCDWLLVGQLQLSQGWAGAVMAAVGVLFLFVALIYMVKMLRQLVLAKVQGLFDRVFFRNAGIAFLLGICLTATVQSSSVTTSLAVPLIGAGMLRLRQVFPYTMGANIGTTVTALLAAMATGSPAGLAVALAHLCFNVFGTVVFWPLAWIPVGLAKSFSRMASRNRVMAVVYVVLMFIVVPASVVAWAAYGR